MTTCSTTFQATHFEQLRQHLLRGDGYEHAAYVLFKAAEIQSDPWDREAHRKFLSTKVIPVLGEQVVESTPNLITWKTTSFIAALKEAQATGSLLGIVHNHPAGSPNFSAQDDENEPKLVRLAQNRDGQETPLLSFILTADSTCSGRLWTSPTYRKPMRMIRVIGDGFDFHYDGRGAGQTRAAFDRQALALGKALNQDLSLLRIGIVGCGGTGSAVAVLLARTGVGNLLLIDNDIVDATNLNRLHGARQADADAMLPKVDVVGRSISELGLGVRVAKAEAWVGDPGCRDALRSCDIIFGCTDDHAGRMLLGRLALFYLIPVIDLGLAIQVDDGRPPKLRALDGRVTVLLLGKTCLPCRGIADATRASEETMRRENPEQYERLKAEAYVFGEGNPSPVVVTFTTELACMAVNEMIHRITGFRGPEGARANLVRKFHQMTDAKPGSTSKSGCMLCDNPHYWGRGDVIPFLDRS